jgi:hypothetical protein
MLALLGLGAAGSLARSRAVVARARVRAPCRMHSLDSPRIVDRTGAPPAAGAAGRRPHRRIIQY